MTDAADYVDLVLEREGDWYRADATRDRVGEPTPTGLPHQSAPELRFTGASVGAVRGAIRDIGNKYPKLTHDDVTALASELWREPVFERRLAAVVLLQSRAAMLRNSDLTRIEGFVRTAGLRALVDPLATDVTGPLLERLAPGARGHADVAVDRWGEDPDRWLRRAAILSSVPMVRASGAEGDGWPRVVRRLRAVVAFGTDPVVDEAVDAVREALAKRSPDVPFPR